MLRDIMVQNGISLEANNPRPRILKCETEDESNTGRILEEFVSQLTGHAKCFQRRECDVGLEFKGRCRKCGKGFRVREGGGFRFHLLRCDTCGKAKPIGIDKLGALHARYLKWLKVPYAVVSRHNDEAARTACADPPISERAYHAGVERIAGVCKCGGQYKFKARPRCPKCRSVSITLGEIERFYD